MPSHWRLAAIQTIARAIDNAPPGADLVKAIDAAYPFGMREYTPYKIWLEERKKVLIKLDLYKPLHKRKCRYHPDGQSCLLCMNGEKS